MAKILAGTVEVPPQCALKWHALLVYVRNDMVLEEVIAEDFPTAEVLAKLTAQNISSVDATKIEEYSTLISKIKDKDTKEALVALVKFRAKVVPLMIQDVVECECER